jgi:Carboxypeptidase regulatory-like domain/TonB dependent receptor/TonB-dependent Receptor Plug Domain
VVKQDHQEVLVKRNCRLSIWGIGLVLIAVAALLAANAPLAAQQVRATITGTVTDPSGAPILGATVTATNLDSGTKWSTETGNEGAYDLPDVSVGRYELKVEAKGFETSIHGAFTLVLNQVARIDVQMKVGEVSQTIEVTSAAPILQTDTTDVGTLLNSEAVVDLPLSTRNINELTLLTPGVTSPNIFAFQAPQTTFGTGRPYVNGAREQDNNFSLDGMDTNQPDNNEVAYVPAPDAVQEFNLIAGNAPTDYGNYIGGVVVETLKSGTNHYHGDLWEFLRNTDLDANSWQNKAVTYFNLQPGGNGQVLQRPALHWNDFGATLGGPIVKNRLFFFADWQTSLYDTPASAVTFAPIPSAFRTGDFSSLCSAGFNASGICNNSSQQLYDAASSTTPANRTPFANNQVPIRSSVANAILSSPLFPPASQSSYLQNQYINSYQGDMRIDWSPTDKDHIMGRWSQQYVINNTANSIALFPDLKREYPLKNFVVDYSRAISPTLVNDARFGFQDFPANDQIYSNPTGQNLPTLFGLPGVPVGVLPDMNFNGLYTDIGSADLVEIFHDTTVEAEDGLTWTHGNHSVHFGFEYFKYLMNDLYPGNQGLAGSFTFTGQFSGNTGTSGGNPFADFLLGDPTSVEEGTPLHFHLRNSLFGGFVQDNWHVTSRLTVNLGLRYELTTPRGDEDSALNINFNKITGAPEIGTNYNTYTGIDNFQPRVGFAWQPGWAPDTVVRGAYGISTYMEGNGVGNMAIINPPNVVTREENNTGLPEPVTTLDQGYSAFPAAICTAAALEALSPNCLASDTVHASNPNLQPAVDQQWNLTIQHRFGESMTVSAGYVGNKIDHMTDIFLLNQGIIQDTGCPTTSPCVVPGPFAQPLINCCGANPPNVRYNDSEAIQRYDALELQVIEHPYHGLELTANYTWSKCLSNSLGYFGQYGDEEGIGQSQTNGGYFFFQNIYNQMADYGRCINDVASAFNGFLIYDLPFGRGHRFGNGVNGVVNQIIGGWSVATDFNIHSGFAIDPAAPDQSQTGGGVGAAYRPNCVSGVSQYGNQALENIAGNIGLQWLNPAAVTLPAQYTFGNCGVGSFRGPGLTTADLNLTKQFHITERFNLQFMTQFINLTNTPIFGAPTASCGPLCNGAITTGPSGGGGAGTFGLVQSQDPGREIQFALKLLF